MTNTLAALCDLYRNEAKSNAAQTLEFELRYQNADYALYKTVFDALSAGKLPVGFKVTGRRTEQTVVSLKQETHARQARTADLAQRVPPPQPMRIITFVKGKSAGSAYRVKTPLAPAVREHARPPFGFVAVLSREAPTTSRFNADEGAILRVKDRVCFDIICGESATSTDNKGATSTGATSTGGAKSTGATSAEGATSSQWRVDLTAVRQVSGQHAAQLPAIVKEMFGSEASAHPNKPYLRYEIEVEHTGDAGQCTPDAVVRMGGLVAAIANPNYTEDAAYRAAVAVVAKYVGWGKGGAEKTLKSVLPQVVALTRAAYRGMYPPVGMWATPKYDGTRAVAFVRNENGAAVAYVLTDGRVTVSQGKQQNLDAKDAKNSTPTVLCMVDAEYVGGTLYVFDIIVADAENVSQMPFAERHKRVGSAVASLTACGATAIAKPYVHLSKDLKKEIEPLLAESKIKLDGLILVKDGSSYGETESYKWKPLSQTTIDFLAVRCPSSVLGKEPFIDEKGKKLFLLFCGIDRDMCERLGLQPCPGYKTLFPGTSGAYFPIQFQPSDTPLAYLFQAPAALDDGKKKLLELRCVGDTCGTGAPPKWDLVKVRGDREKELASGGYFGNDFRVAETTWLNYVDVFPAAELWTGPAGDYFAGTKADMYKAQTALLSHFKTERIRTLQSAQCVVDFGFGRGQDIGRYLAAGVRNLVGVDRDRAALAEAVRRKFDHARGRKGPKNAKSASHGMTLHIVAADLADPFEATLAKLRRVGVPEAGADGAVCNLALHYLLRDLLALRNFAALCRSSVRVGGTLSCLVMAGEKVFALLKGLKPGGTWDVRVAGALRYSLKRQFTATGFLEAGQEIGVLMPFSGGNYYTEYLVNAAVVTRELKAKGFALVSATPADKYLNAFMASNSVLGSALAPEDIKYVGLFVELLYKREK